jgi:hypothetical protein
MRVSGSSSRFLNAKQSADRPAALTGEAEPARLWAVLATITFNVIGVALLTLAPWSNWRTGLAMNIVDQAILLGVALRFRDALMARLWIYGLVTGLVELAADAWLVDFTHTLNYSVGGGPLIWRSPAWMPFAWQIVTIQFSVLGMRLMRWRPLAGLAITGLLGAVNIPYYEEMARSIHWWQYSGCRMISGTPYYIILGEFGIAVGIAWLAQRTIQGSWPKIIGAGTIAGLMIFACYAAAFFLTDRLGWASR